MSISICICICVCTHQYVVIIGLDFSKAFDAVRYSSGRSGYTWQRLQLAGIVLQWPSTLYKKRWDVVDPSGIIQGSGIGPASYVVNSSDLSPPIRQFSV